VRLHEDFWSKLDFLNELIDLPPSPINPLRYFKFSNAHIQQICTVFLYADLEHIHSFIQHLADMHRANLLENLHHTVHLCKRVAMNILHIWHGCSFILYSRRRHKISFCVGRNRIKRIVCKYATGPRTTTRIKSQFAQA
jgi:hypothetical protein